MKVWKIPVAWEMCGIVTVEANTLETAMDIARNESSNIQLPDDGNYVDGSWDLSMEEEDEIRSCYNNNQKDEGDD